MLLHAALLAILPLVAVCQVDFTTKSRLTNEYLEKKVKPCLLDQLGYPCPIGISFKDVDLTYIVRAIREHKISKECECDLKDDGCARKCYYEESLQMFLDYGGMGKTADEIKAIQEQLRNTFDTTLKSCILEGKDCSPALGDMSIDRITKELESYKTVLELPKECSGDLDSAKDSIRPCYYNIIKKHLAQVQPSNSVLLVLQAPISDAEHKL